MERLRRPNSFWLKVLVMLKKCIVRDSQSGKNEKRNKRAVTYPEELPRLNHYGIG